MRIFISGPMKNDPDHEKKFEKMEKIIKELGHSPFNPCWMKVDNNWRRHNLIAIDKAAIEQCDAVIFMKNWEMAGGCMFEMQHAMNCNKAILIMANDGFNDGIVFNIMNSAEFNSTQIEQFSSLASAISDKLKED